MNNLAKGIALTIAYVICFALVGLILKIIGPQISAWEKVFSRGVGFFIMAVVLVRSAQRKAKADATVPYRITFYGSRQNQVYLFLRSVFGVLAAICNITIVNHISLADADMLEKLYMLYMVLLSAWFLGEHATKWHYLLIVACLPALALIIKPSFDNPDLSYYLIGLAGGMCLAISFTAVRALAIKPVGEHPATTMVHFSTTMMLMTVVPAVLSHLGWGWFGDMTATDLTSVSTPFTQGTALLSGELADGVVSHSVASGVDSTVGAVVDSELGFSVGAFDSPWVNYSLLVLACFFAALGALSMTYSYKYASSKETSVYGYTGVLFNGLLGFLFFGTEPDAWTLLGYAIIVGCGVILFLYNRYLFKRDQEHALFAQRNALNAIADD